MCTIYSGMIRTFNVKYQKFMTCLLVYGILKFLILLKSDLYAHTVYIWILITKSIFKQVLYITIVTLFSRSNVIL